MPSYDRFALQSGTIPPSMKGLPAETDFVVIGAGVAGLRAAIELAAGGRVLVLDKSEISGSDHDHTPGLSDEDEITIHLQDTLDAGDGLCNIAAVKTLVEEAPERIQELIAWNKHLDGGAKLVFGPENPRSRDRSLHAPGGSTPKEIARTLYAKAHSLKHI